jgi:hypothetical protein
MEMDADFSHKPEDVPRMVSALSGGADFVIGSRYVEGGTIPENWGLMRKLISRCGNIFARYIAGMYRIRDCTAGFRAIRVSILEKIDLAGLHVQGYAFQIALLNQAVARKAVIREIPVEFVDRERGETKIGLSDILEFMINAWWIQQGFHQILRCGPHRGIRQPGGFFAVDSLRDEQVYCVPDRHRDIHNNQFSFQQYMDIFRKKRRRQVSY